MKVIRRHMRVGLAVWCLVAMVFGQTLFLPLHAVAQVGRPPLPSGIVRLPFNGEYEIFEVPGCGYHDRNRWETREPQELNDRAFDFGLYKDEVLAAGEGDVIGTYTDDGGALTLVIYHGEGVRTYYVHLQEFRAQVGDHVFPGDVIAISGNTGFGGTYHLHFAATVNNTDDNPRSIGDAANINSLPGIPWASEQLNEDGYAVCNPNARDFAVGGAIAQQPDAPETVDEPSLTAVGYDRNAAVNAAYEYLSNDYDSARYVSNALWAGGLPQTDEWTQVAAANPNDLVNYLVTNHDLSDGSSYLPATKTQIAWSDNTAQGAMLGDVIAYDWEGDGIVDHVAVVTNINSDGFPEVSEHSPTQENRFWSYSITVDNWIEFAYPGSVAYLIQIAPLSTAKF